MDSNTKNFRFAEAVVLSSTDHTCKYNSVIYVGTGGGISTVKVATVGGQDVTFTSVPSGTIIPLMVTKVYKTGTDATNLVALAD
ncbi:MAG: hypothetical protein PHS33_09210 [Candidatus Omnitrophica bacterium]|nr:hypothetical protein [Candidatus Omnitrophota bacterium]